MASIRAMSKRIVDEAVPALQSVAVPKFEDGKAPLRLLLTSSVIDFVLRSTGLANIGHLLERGSDSWDHDASPEAAWLSHCWRVSG